MASKPLILRTVQIETAEVGLDAGKARLFRAAVRAMGGFAASPRTLHAIFCCTKHSKGQSSPRNELESGECRLTGLLEGQMAVNLMWRKVVGKDVALTGPSMLISYRDGVGVLLQVDVERGGGADPIRATAHKYRHWILRLFNRGRDDQVFWMTEERTGGGGRRHSKMFVSDGSPWLPAPDNIPGQVRWRFDYNNVQSGLLTVTHADLVIDKWCTEVAVTPTVETSAAGVADLKVTAGSMITYKSRCAIHALKDPQLLVELLLPWRAGDSVSLADVVKQYAESIPASDREPESTLNAKMTAAGLTGDRPQGWEVYLESPPSSLDKGEDGELTLVTVTQGTGRVLAAVRVTNLDTNKSLITDLVEIVRQ